MKLQIEKYGGLIPRTEAKLLPDTAAQTALNCNLTAGNLRVFKQTSLERTIAAGVKTIYRRGSIGRPGAVVSGAGYAISGGDYLAKTNAFDGGTTTQWASSQTTTAIDNTAYIGQNFGAGNSKKICKMRLRLATSGNAPTTAMIQRSLNGSTWTDVSEMAIDPTNTGSYQEFTFTSTTAAQYWRLLATSDCQNSGRWYVAELQMVDWVDGEDAAEWLDFVTLCNIAKGCINADEYNRILWTGDADGELKVRGDFGTAGAAETRDATIAKPTAPITATVTPFWAADKSSWAIIANFGLQPGIDCPIDPVTGITVSEDGETLTIRARYPGSYTAASGGIWITDIRDIAINLAGIGIMSPVSNSIIGVAQEIRYKNEAYCTLAGGGVANENEDTTWIPRDFGFTPAYYHAKMNPFDLVITLSLVYAVSLSSRYYCQRYVTDIVEEGDPGQSISTMVEARTGDTVTLALGAAPGGNVENRRIYRSAGSILNNGFLFLDEIAAATANYSDTKQDTELAESMPAYGDPPNEMYGLIRMPGGILAAAGSNKHDIYFSEPFIPCAWPVEYMQTVEYEIVGFGAYGNTLIVCTNGKPELIIGDHPELFCVRQIPVNQACVSAQGICSSRGAVFYPSPDGLVMVSNGTAQLVTEKFFTREQWQELQPDTMIAEVHDNKVFMFTDVGTWVYDPAEEALVTTDEEASALFYEIEDDSLYLAQTTSCVKWEGGTENKTSIWKSKKFSLNRPANFSCAKIIAADYSITTGNVILRLYTNDTLVYTGTIPAAQINLSFRLPVMRKERDWEIEVETTVNIDKLILTQSMGEF
ncbi:MAG: hypothetical protein A2020_12185 [Lentisphaerae bacterium GWF2_45_14]|nr:MAG: hypothetical protein A2020_12185 [Lentisphaerae bacterium GWF2_45_14]